MAEKILNTRIQLKYDSLQNWAANNTLLKSGEVAIAYLPPKGTGVAPDAVSEAVLMKVGPGNFNDLPFVSALAADVYAWAKKPTLDVNDLPTLPIMVVDPISDNPNAGKFITNITYANNKLTITRSDVALADISDKEKIALSADLGNVATLTTTAKTAVGAINEHDAEIGDLTSLNTTNKGNLVAAINEALQAVEVGGTGSVVTVTRQATPTDGSEVTYVVNQGGRAVDVKIEIPKYDTSADYGVLEVKGDTASGVEVDTTDAQRPIVKIKAETYDTYGAAASAESAAKGYTDQKLLDFENAYIKADENGTIDKLNEIAAWIADDQAGATKIIADVAANTANIQTVSGDLDKVELQLNGIPAGDGTVKTAIVTAESNAKGYADSLASNYATAAQGATADQTAATIAGYGDVVTFNVSAFAMASETGAKALAEENKAAIEVINNTETGILAQAKKDSSDKVAVALAEAQKYADDLASNYATAAQGEKANSALQEIEAGTGLKVSAKADNKQTIDLDESVTFIFNCGTATEVV